MFSSDKDKETKQDEIYLNSKDVNSSQDKDMDNTDTFGRFDFKLDTSIKKPEEPGKLVEETDVFEIRSQGDLTEYIEALIEEAKEIPLKDFMVNQSTKPLAKEVNDRTLINQKASQVILSNVKELQNIGFSFLSKELLEFICTGSLDIPSTNEAVYNLINELSFRDVERNKEIADLVIGKEEMIIKLIDHIE